MTTTTKPAAMNLDGRLLLPGDGGYDQARAVWNAMVDRRPRMIVRCASVTDVVTAVRTARELDLEIGVRCGGHSGVGHAVPDGGLMIDLTPLSDVAVDPTRRRAHVRGGALLGALDRASQAHGLATTAGNVSHTGVGGLTLGGGMGWLARQYGLACDNVESYQVVTASGEVVRASRDEHPDLFWGLRGGGGNFGIVTGFEFRLHDTGTRTLVAAYDFPLDRAFAALRAWRDLNAEAPRQATSTASVGRDGLTTLGFVWVGDPAAGRAYLPALRALGRPVAERVTEPSYVELQTREDSVQGHTYRRYAKGHYLRSFPDEAIEAFLLRGTGNGHGAYLPNAGLQAYGGAIDEVPDEDAAFSHRGTLFEWGTGTRWTDPGEDDARMAASRQAAATLAPHASGVYVNALSDEGAEGVRRAYPPAKLAKLTAVKDRYDPDNVFHLNQNIRPSGR
ncbi:MAG: FAD-binding protein [Actinophytocola sp.]|uniref:FAD-binding oxidoreductase n=1 Tax=Actinophytocola sp. TaxID=1872138 RepID=UPI00132C9421|nr:FAD-binding oxidoreductase [Actinophytocola sp.]MPZ81219.1 FAD-binding protein [Actinophytocola sp.]